MSLATTNDSVARKLTALPCVKEPGIAGAFAGGCRQFKEKPDTLSYQSQSILDELLEFDAKNGFLYWKPRSEKWFNNQNATSYFNAHHAGTRAMCCLNRRGYYTGRLLQKTVYAHRVIWILAHGTYPAAIDHINGDRLDNRLENLRGVDFRENARNRRLLKGNTSGFFGLIEMQNGWKAEIEAAGIRYVLGTYRTKDEAVAARKAAELVLGFHTNHGKSP